MDISVDIKNSVERTIKITVPAEEVAAFFNDSFKTIAKTAKLHGFRPGKVPLKVVKKLYAKEVREEARSHFIQEGYTKALTENKLYPVVDPHFSDIPQNISPDEDFTFTFDIEVLPELTVDVKEHEIPFKEVQFEEKMLEDEMEGFRKRLIEYEETEDVSRKGDKVTISFKGSIDGKEIDGTSGENVDAVVGAGEFVADFDAALEGRKAGETITVPVTFPEDYREKEIAGKTVDFTIEFVKIARPKEEVVLTDEFLKNKENLPDSVEEVKEIFEKQIKDYLNSVNRDVKRSKVVEKYLDDFQDLEVPPTMLAEEIEQRLTRIKEQDKTLSDEEAKAKAEKEALSAIRRYIILGKVAADHNIEASDADLDELLSKEAAQYGIPLEYLKQVYDETKLNEKRHIATEEKTMDFLVSKARFTDEPEHTEEMKEENGE